MVRSKIEENHLVQLQIELPVDGIIALALKALSRVLAQQGQQMFNLSLKKINWSWRIGDGVCTSKASSNNCTTRGPPTMSRLRIALSWFSLADISLQWFGLDFGLDTHYCLSGLRVQR